MSSLINDLNQIYNVKGQIKEVANIPTDVFSDFPTYIAAAIASGGATGEIEITTNGTHDVSTYASAYVNVPQETVPVVPEGYTYVEGTKTITENGTVDVSSYASAYVQVPIPEGFIYPTGYAYITTNGDFPIREFQYVNVNVPTSGGLDWDDVAQAGYIVPAGTVNIHDNRTIDVKDYAYANVDVPIPSGYVLPAGSKTITANAMGIDVATYAYVDVNVSGGGSNVTELSTVFGADEYDSSKHIAFTETSDAFTYQFTCQYDGSDWTGSLSNNGFALCGRVGSATRYQYNDQTGQMDLVTVYDAIKMHFAAGAMYLGDILAAGVGSLASGSIDIAADLYTDGQFSNNGFGAGPENLDMSEWASGTLTFTLTVPKDFYANYGTCYDYIETGNVRQINSSYVNLSWSFSGVPA